jgi:hypothetical protein
VNPETRQDRLAAMNDAWQAAEASEEQSEKKEWENPPDGEYQARVHSFDFHDGKNGLALRTQFELLGPHNAGWKVSTFHPLEDRDRLKWTKQHLSMLGVNAHSLEELESALPSALDKVCDVALRTRKGKDGREWQNLYLNRVVGGVTASESQPVSGEEPPPHDDEDRPKPKDEIPLDDIPF